MKASELIYEKYGTRVAASDESDENLRKFVFEGTKSLAEAKGWELLYGCFQRVPAGYWDEDEIFAYLWPIARPKPRCQEPTCPDFGDPDFGELTCPSEHAEERPVEAVTS